MSSNNGIDKRKQVFFSQAEINEMLDSIPSNVRRYIDSLQSQISNMSDIGLALSKERDMEKLLEMILLEAKRISNASEEVEVEKALDDAEITDSEIPNGNEAVASEDKSLVEKFRDAFKRENIEIS